MSNRHSSPIHAYAPDADRAGLAASADLPEWLVHLLAVLAYLARKWALATGRRSSFELGDWMDERTDLPPGSAQAVAAAVRGAFGNSIAWMCLRHGIGPGHKDWPAMSRAIVRFGGSVAGFRAGLPAFGLEWWENPGVIPGMISAPAPRPAAEAVALRLSRQAMADTPPPALHLVPNSAPADARPAVAPAPCRLVFARTATDPPTGPPARGHRETLLRLIDRGQSMAGPAVLIRATAMLHQQRHAA